MDFAIAFLEGIITFVSPCLLPMLPVYLSYFAVGEGGTKRTMINALGFCLGFTVVFVALGSFASALGSLLSRYRMVLDIITGLVVIFFGLNIMGVLKLGFFNAQKRITSDLRPSGFFSSLLFGMVFSLGWTPCVGAFLGSALMMASQRGSVLAGVLMLLAYSLGLGIPFLLSALLLEQLKGAFDFIKRNYERINQICGGLLVLVGLLMAIGLFGRVLGVLGGI